MIVVSTVLRLVGVCVVRVQGGCRVVWREALGAGFVRGGLCVMGGGETEGAVARQESRGGDYVL